MQHSWLRMSEGEHVSVMDDMSRPVDLTIHKEDPQKIKEKKKEFTEHFQAHPPPPTPQQQFAPDLSENPQIAAQIQRENRDLAQELESKVDQVRIVEKQVVEISTLQETFSTKVEEQAEEIENLHQLAIESTSRVTHAKDILSKASDDGINFRLFILVLLTTMAIQLLFVHMYN